MVVISPTISIRLLLKTVITHVQQRELAALWRFTRALAFSRVGGYESAAADALRRDGVDLALVFSEQSDGYRVTGRASDSFAEQLSLGGSLLPTLIDRFDGSGGGHENAGSATLHTDDRYAVERFALEQVEQQLDTTFTATAADSITR